MFRGGSDTFRQPSGVLRHQTSSPEKNQFTGGVFMRVFALGGIFALAALLCGDPASAQKIELFGGYSFVRAPVTFSEVSGTCALPCLPTSTTPKLNLNGWEASGAVKIAGPLAFVADFDGTRGSFQGASTHLNTYLFGPQFRLPGPISLFAHAMAGEGHESIHSGISGAGVITSGPTQNSFASALGGGLDTHLLPFISLRLIQVDYLYTHFHSTRQNQPRISAGFVVHF
jgi:hypothetical protein